MRTVVGIRPGRRASRDSSHTGEPTPTVWFASWRQLAGVLSDENRHALKALLPPFVGPKVIYAAANRMGGRAAREGITFKQTPYALEV